MWANRIPISSKRRGAFGSSEAAGAVVAGFARAVVGAAARAIAASDHLEKA